MIFINNIPVYRQAFPNNEHFIDFNTTNLKKDENIIYFKFEEEGEIFWLICLSEKIKKTYPKAVLNLVMPYIPYSKMDREEEIRLFSLKTFANLLNSVNFDKVTALEAHSEVSLALINNIHHVNKSREIAIKAGLDILKIEGITINNTKNEKEIFEKFEEAGIYFIYPDYGAEKRYKKQIAYKNTLVCSKTRDFQTGEIKDLQIHSTGEEKIKYGIIVDDLVMAGGTFIQTAEKLKEKFSVKSIYLAVTHCENVIFKGNLLKTDLVEKIYTTDSVLNFECSEETIDYNRFQVFSASSTSII